MVNKSDANFIMVLLANVFFGALGVHRFMVGKVGTGILMIVLCLTGVSTIWAVVDLVLLGTGNFLDSTGKPVLP